MRTLKKIIRNSWVISTMFLFIVNDNLFAQEYYCPKLPLKAKIGDKISENWQVTYDSTEEISLFNTYYQKYFGKERRFLAWIAIGGTNQPENSYYIIECCGPTDEKKESLCVRKRIKNGPCSTVKNIQKFVCLNEGQTEPKQYSRGYRSISYQENQTFKN